jgi:serine/threonine protein kinase
MCQRISDRMIAQGTPSYLAPEMVSAWHATSREHKRYTGSSDIFSFGVLMTNILTNKYPFRRITARLRRGISLSKDEMDSVFSCPTKRYHEIEKKGQKFAVVVKLCLRVDPTERADAPFLREILKMESL